MLHSTICKIHGGAKSTFIQSYHDSYSVFSLELMKANILKRHTKSQSTQLLSVANQHPEKLLRLSIPKLLLCLRHRADQ